MSDNRIHSLTENQQRMNIALDVSERKYPQESKRYGQAPTEYSYGTLDRGRRQYAVAKRGWKEATEEAYSDTSTAVTELAAFRVKAGELQKQLRFTKDPASARILVTTLQDVQAKAQSAQNRLAGKRFNESQARFLDYFGFGNLLPYDQRITGLPYLPSGIGDAYLSSNARKSGAEFLKAQKEYEKAKSLDSVAKGIIKTEAKKTLIKKHNKMLDKYNKWRKVSGVGTIAWDTSIPQTIDAAQSIDATMTAYTNQAFAASANMPQASYSAPSAETGGASFLDIFKGVGSALGSLLTGGAALYGTMSKNQIAEEELKAKTALNEATFDLQKQKLINDQAIAQQVAQNNQELEKMKLMTQQAVYQSQINAAAQQKLTSATTTAATIQTLTKYAIPAGILLLVGMLVMKKK